MNDKSPEDTTADSKADDRPEMNKFLDNTSSDEVDSDKPAESKKP